MLEGAAAFVRKAHPTVIATTASLLDELRRGFAISRTYRDLGHFAVFGSARTPAEHPDTALATAAAALFKAYRLMQRNGAGPGLMEALARGAPGWVQGERVILPFEQPTAPLLQRDPKLLYFANIDLRKLFFLEQSKGALSLHGGSGTHDELAELVALMRRGKHPVTPVILLEHPGGSYWTDYHKVLEQQRRAGTLTEHDPAFFSFVDTPQAALDVMLDFYRNVHSYRFVDSELVVRLKGSLSERAVAELDARYGDDLVARGGRMRQTRWGLDPEDELMHLPRLVFPFTFSRYDRLRGLLADINREELVDRLWPDPREAGVLSWVEHPPDPAEVERRVPETRSLFETPSELQAALRARVAELGTTPGAAALLEAVVDMAHTLPLNELKFASSVVKDLRLGGGQAFGTRPVLAVLGADPPPGGRPSGEQVEANRRLAVELVARLEDWAVCVDGNGCARELRQAATAGLPGDRVLRLELRTPTVKQPVARSHDPGATRFRTAFMRARAVDESAAALAFVPGDFFETADGLFRALMQMQTGLRPVRPIVLLETPTGDAASSIVAYARELALKYRTMNPEDMNLIYLAHSADDAAAHIQRFWRNFSGYERDGDDLVIRLRKPLAIEQLERLNADPRYRVMRGTHAPITQELAVPAPDGSNAQRQGAVMARLILPKFNFKSFGVLRQLIDSVNAD